MFSFNQIKNELVRKGVKIDLLQIFSFYEELLFRKNGDQSIEEIGEPIIRDLKDEPDTLIPLFLYIITVLIKNDGFIDDFIKELTEERFY